MGKDAGNGNVSANEMGLAPEDLIRHGATQLIQSAIETRRLPWWLSPMC
jgi:hypothetical protein